MYVYLLKKKRHVCLFIKKRIDMYVYLLRKKKIITFDQPNNLSHSVTTLLCVSNFFNPFNPLSTS